MATMKCAAEPKSEERKDTAEMKKIAKSAVTTHEKRVHKMAAGGMVARGGGAAKKGLKFSRNG